MKKLFLGFLLITMGLLAGTALARDITDASVDKLISISGLKKQVEQIPESVRMGAIGAIQQDGLSEPDKGFEEFLKLIGDAFIPSEFLDSIRMEIKNNLSESEAKDLIDWYESDLGKMITKADEEASTPEGIQKMMAEIQSFRPDEDRLGIIKKMMSTTKVIDRLLQLQEKTGLAGITLVSKIRNPDRPVNVEAFNSMMSAQRPQIRAALEQQLAMVNTYFYKDIDINSLDEYLEFLKLPNTKKYNNSLIAGMVDGMLKGNDKMLSLLEVMIKEQKKESEKIMIPTTLTE